MEKELAIRIIKEVADFAIDCWDRDYVKFDLIEGILSLDEEISENYTQEDGDIDIEQCIKDAISALETN
jgi:hypothetical protein